jgi:hypothetical protein
MSMGEWTNRFKSIPTKIYEIIISAFDGVRAQVSTGKGLLTFVFLLLILLDLTHLNIGIISNTKSLISSLLGSKELGWQAIVVIALFLLYKKK